MRRIWGWKNGSEQRRGEGLLLIRSFHDGYRGWMLLARKVLVDGGDGETDGEIIGELLGAAKPVGESTGVVKPVRELTGVKASVLVGWRADFKGEPLAELVGVADPAGVLTDVAEPAEELTGVTASRGMITRGGVNSTTAGRRGVVVRLALIIARARFATCCSSAVTG